MIESFLVDLDGFLVENEEVINFMWELNRFESV